MKSSSEMVLPLVPVASEKTRSPSSGVCDSHSARENPSWAAIARRFASALVRMASVAMTAIVVFFVSLCCLGT